MNEEQNGERVCEKFVDGESRLMVTDPLTQSIDHKHVGLKSSRSLSLREVAAAAASQVMIPSSKNAELATRLQEAVAHIMTLNTSSTLGLGQIKFQSDWAYVRGPSNHAIKAYFALSLANARQRHMQQMYFEEKSNR
mmetsp:Transcript_12857/g.31337  ORF Transcript_12857/g.31337 Transcript_12857/m.31337 type:complete len:137 (+) Transcript_12857:180-590(+)